MIGGDRLNLAAVAPLIRLDLIRIYQSGPRNGRRPLWVNRVGFVMSALRPVCPQQQTFSGAVGTSHWAKTRLSDFR
jgi:hypothetical protein